MIPASVAPHRIAIELQLHQMASTSRAKRETKTIHVRIDSKLKRSTDRIFSDLGISTSEVIRLFLQQVEMHEGLPFESISPSEKTISAMEQATDPDRLHHYRSFHELHKQAASPTRRAIR